ncbi:PUA-like domain-containing protein [Lophiotrema nucula]|uniref:Thymocyte nuclear protein 1 n=1 Tax=Lophiotrema nucula TaxID=690887 RepID=A0A6A5YL15_9PLEO|nr:PUA-like domain-containing protein [Lophiotrema nucula]
MAGARRSTRKAAVAAPKYTDTSPEASEAGAPKANGTKKTTTRRKRARDEDDDEAIAAEDSPPPKKAAKAKPKPKASNPKSAVSTRASKPSTTASPAAKPPSTIPTPSNSSNRDADGNQEVFWLLKAEPLPRYENGVNVAFSIDDLAACTQPEPWSGVRNPQATNNMKMMRKGDLGFFYHSNAKPSGVVGVLRVVEEAKVDESAFEKGDPYFDAKSVREKPRWWCVGVEFVRKFGEVVDLHTLKGHAGKGGPLEGMQLVTNSRLSVSRVGREQWEFILGLAEGKEEEDAGAAVEDDEA